MSDTTQVTPVGPAVLTVGDDAAVDIESSINEATGAVDHAAINRALWRLKEASPEQYAELMAGHSSAKPDAWQLIVQSVQSEAIDDLHRNITKLRDNDPKAFREMVLELQSTDAFAFQQLVSHLQSMAHDALKELFTKLGVTRVVCVDDEYGRIELDYVIGLIEAAGSEMAKEVSFFDGIPLNAGSDVYAEELREKWENTDTETRTAVCHDIRRLFCARTDIEDHAGEERDARDAGFLSLLLDGLDFLPISLTQWKQRRTTLIEEAETTTTLFLFDQDLRHDKGREREGIGLLQAVLDSTGDDVLCGLLSHTITLDNEISEWKHYCAGEGVERPMNSHRFILISKRHLYPDPMSFVRMAKLTALNARCEKLKQKVETAFVNAQEAAIAEARQMDVYDFEHLVFRSSQVEGVWEPDTLFRILGIYHRVNARKEARGDGNELEKLAEEIRAVSGIVTGPRYSPSERTWRIRHYEIYEDSEIINKYQMPLELGDVFETDSGKMYILLRQPCDLMLRKDKRGERHHAVSEADVAEVFCAFDDTGRPRSGFSNQGRPERPEDYFELPCFDFVTGQSRYVWFRSRRTVALSVLDLCVFDREGKACLTLDAPASESLTALWRLRYATLQKDMTKCGQKYADLKKQPGRTEEEALKIFPQSSNLKSIFKVSYDANSKRLVYDFRRLLRLCQPRAGALLTRYASYLSRDAFEHDFTEGIQAE